MKNILIVTKFTFIEVYRSKIMIGLVLMAFAQLLMSYIASEFAYGVPDKIALDFGFGIMSFSNSLIAIFIGANLLSKEVESRTLYMILSRPINRSQFLIGKIMGLSSILFVNTFFLFLVSSILYKILGGQFSTLMVSTALFSFFEGFILLLFSVLFSLISTVSLSVIFTFVIFVVGHLLNDTTKMYISKSKLLAGAILRYVSFIVPDLEKFNLREFLVYQQKIEGIYLANSAGYFFFYSLALLFLLSIVFNHKNLD